MRRWLHDIGEKPAMQQPEWGDASAVDRVRRTLMECPALVRHEDVLRLRALLARVAVGDVHVVQAGDCSEDPAECTRGDVARKAGLVEILGGLLKMTTHRPVLRAGRIAGQYAKPRSRPTERVGDTELPVYRGHFVNGPEPDPDSRRPDLARLLNGYQAASEVFGHLGWQSPTYSTLADAPLWTSHEALLLDYEIPMLRPVHEGLLLSSTHWPWIGERTRQVDGAHVALLSRVVNPIGCKIGPSVTEAELLQLCDVLDPARDPGRLTLIARMGADAVAEVLPPLVDAVRRAGHPVIWLVDPMHANTVTAPNGLKTRFLNVITREVKDFQCAVRSAGGTDGGLHLETTPDDVTECVANESFIDGVGGKYTTLCDPRLNPEQAMAVVSCWRG